jgi:putative transposase
MTSTTQRQNTLNLIETATQNGARQSTSCKQLSVGVRTLQRWRKTSHLQGLEAGDARIHSRRSSKKPANQLSCDEQAHLLAVANSEPFKNLPPSQIVPKLADQGIYLASASTFSRLLKKQGQTAHRRSEQPKRQIAKPKALVATAPNQVYCWDITYLPSCIKGQYYFLYLFVDLFSRFIVGWQVFASESASLAAHLITDICTRQGIQPHQLTLHSDNGAPMKGHTMLATLQYLGINTSRSRPSVSNDNPYSESLFKTLKYRPDLPLQPFDSLSHANQFTEKLVNWYNLEHCHSSIAFCTPAERHAGLDQSILAQRRALFEQAKNIHPERWSGQSNPWKYQHTVHLNPNSPKKGPVII